MSLIFQALLKVYGKLFPFDVWTCMVRYVKFREIVIQSFRLQLTNQSLLLLLYSFLFQSSLFTFPFSKFLPSISPIVLHIMFEETVWNKQKGLTQYCPVDIILLLAHCKPFRFILNAPKKSGRETAKISRSEYCHYD